MAMGHKANTLPTPRPASGNKLIGPSNSPRSPRLRRRESGEGGAGEAGGEAQAGGGKGPEKAPVDLVATASKERKAAAERKQREQQEREVCTLRRARLPIAGQLPLPSQRQL